jgi:hypothetical protein
MQMRKVISLAHVRQRCYGDVCVQQLKDVVEYDYVILCLLSSSHHRPQYTLSVYMVHIGVALRARTNPNTPRHTPTDKHKN